MAEYCLFIICFHCTNMFYNAKVLIKLYEINSGASTTKFQKKIKMLNITRDKGLSISTTEIVFLMVYILLFYNSSNNE